MFSGGKKERACSILKILFRPEPQDGSRGVLPASPVVGSRKVKPLQWFMTHNRPRASI